MRMRKQRIGILGLLLTSCLWLSGNAHATLIGDSVDILWDVPSLNFDFSDTVIVGAGPEITSNDGTDIGSILLSGESIDIGDASIALTITGGGLAGDEVLYFTDLDWIDQPGFITGFSTIDGANLTSSNVSFTDDSVTLSFGAATPGTFSINLDVAHVPEPNVLALLSLGLVGLGFTRRRMKA